MHILRSADGLDDVLAEFRAGPLAVDTETPDLDWTTGVTGAINLAAGESACCAIGDALSGVVRWLSRQIKRERTFVFHNAKFDMHWLWRSFGLHFPYPVHDTAVMSFLLDNRGVRAFGNYKDNPHSLKPLAATFMDPDAKDHETALMAAIRARFGRAKGIHKGYWPILLGTEDEHLFTHYSAYDPWYTLGLYHLFKPRIDTWPQPYPDMDPLSELYETERWLILAFRDMEELGIMVDRPFLEQWKDELATKMRKAKKKLVRIAGRDINWNSVPQLRELLYGKSGLGLEVQRWTKPKRGKEDTHVAQPSTDEVALLTLGHPIGEALVNFREADKQHGTYAVGLLNAICDDGAIRCTFKSTGAGTGRTSCEDPNLQQQTRESGVRKAYRPRKGLKFRMADFSQVEMRFAGHFANEKSLIEGFNKDPNFDTHKSNAQLMYGIESPSERQRKFGKILNFTKLFGGGISKVAEQLQERLKLPEVFQALRELNYRPKPGESPYMALAYQLNDRFSVAMPGMAKATRLAGDEAQHLGYITNVYGRHRFLEDDRWYAAFNTRVQGTAGDKAKRGLVAVYRECQLNRGELALLLLIHDEIVYESEGDPRTDRRVLELMQDLKRFKVPIIADMSGSNTTWQDKQKIKL